MKALSVLCVFALAFALVEAASVARLRDKAVKGVLEAGATTMTAAQLQMASEMRIHKMARALASTLKYDAFEHSETAHVPNTGNPKYFTDSTTNRGPLPLPMPSGAYTTDSQVIQMGSATLSFGEMTAIAGDFFTSKAFSNIVCNSEHDITLNQVIMNKVLPKRLESGKRARYMAAFNDFAENPYYAGGRMKVAVDQVKAMIAQEKGYVIKAEQAAGAKVEPELSTKAYKAFYADDWFTTRVVYTTAISRDQAWNEKLSGFQEMVMGLSLNDDHFGDCGRQTWTMGHTIALEFAAQAKTLLAAGKKAEADAAMLHAYRHEAFVSHFLTDQFAAGHVRGPRKDVKPYCNGMIEGMPAAGLTANLQHDEDGANCLFVTNKVKQVFWTCGDEKFFDQVNVAARVVVRQAIEAGIQDLVATSTGAARPTHGALDYVPSLDFSALGAYATRMRLENT